MSILNYTGGKSRYIKELLEILPKREGLTVCDPFMGGGCIMSNLPESWAVDASDIVPQLVELHQEIQDDGEEFVESHSRIFDGELLLPWIERKQCFIGHRNAYNNGLYTNGPGLLFYLICRSYSNYMRFSSSNEFNVDYGRRTFNTSMQKKLREHIKRLAVRDIEIRCRNVFDIDLGGYDITFFDPPYLNTTAVYNEKGGWTESDEIALIQKAEKECKSFVWFGQFVSNGIVNEHLMEFAKRYEYKVLKDTTANCSANKKRGKQTIEVMIYNFGGLDA